MDLDTIVIGVGGWGAAVTDALAGRGQRVLAIDRFGVAHDRGSSHGRTRIVRQAYFESPAYIPLLRRAYELWDTVPADAGLRRVGCLSIGAAASPVVTGAARSAAEWGIAVEELTAGEIRRRFPAFAAAPDEVAVFEPDAGFVRPEETVRFYAGRAVERGAEIRTGEQVLGFEPVGGRVRVRTTSGELRADRVVLTAGAWTPSLSPVQLPIRVERRVMHFFTPRSSRPFAPAAMPTFIWDLAAEDSIYGFPADGHDGVKIGFHNRGERTDPEHPQHPGTSAEVADLRGVLEQRMPQAPGEHVRSVGCLYDLTPDHHFVVGELPGSDGSVIVAAGSSGHGFKFVPVIGEVVADLASIGETPYDLDFLSPERFRAAAVSS